MERYITVAAGLVQSLQRIYARKWSFLALFALLFVGSVAALAELGLLPEAPKAQSVTTSLLPVASSVATSTPVIAESPLKIEIPSIKLATAITNPTTTDITLLDKALLRGAVRYPTSALLGGVGNVVLFGHSSYLPVVGNMAYKAFNGIQKLKVGDTVMVYSATTAYTYSVRSVAKESTVSAGIALDVPGRVLTLSTCDSFGAPTDRYVVTADFVESHSISN